MTIVIGCGTELGLLAAKRYLDSKKVRKTLAEDAKAQVKTAVEASPNVRVAGRESDQDADSQRDNAPPTFEAPGMTEADLIAETGVDWEVLRQHGVNIGLARPCPASDDEAPSSYANACGMARVSLRPGDHRLSC